MDCRVIQGPRTGACPLDFARSRNSKMGGGDDDDAAREDARREYQSSLEDLTFNSKPHINMLTILAEENLHFAKDIVAIIEAQISKVFINIEFSQFKLFFLFFFKHRDKSRGPLVNMADAPRHVLLRDLAPLALATCFKTYWRISLLLCHFCRSKTRLMVA